MSEADASAISPRSLRVPAADGLELRVLEWSTEGVPLLFLHGFSNEAHIWDDIAPVVAPYYRTIAVDQRGHGESDWHPEAAYSFDDMADDVEALLAHFDIDRFVLVGHSMGGRVSMCFADRHPERLAGLVIVDTGPVHDPRGIARISMEVGAHLDPSFASVAEFAELCAHNYASATPDALRRMAEHGVKQREDGRYVLKMDPKIRDFGARTPDDPEERERVEKEMEARMWDALAKQSCPTLVVRGAASDILAADTADKMVDEVLVNGTLAVVPRCGHSVMTDNPRGFAKAITSFVLGE